MSTRPSSPAGSSSIESSVKAAANRLTEAFRSRVPCAPISDLIGPDDVVSAYRVQTLYNARRQANGSAVVGRKIGATSEAVQVQLGVDQPDFGVLFDDMAYVDGACISMDELLQPKAEAEVAFVLDRDLATGNLDVDQCRAAVAYATAALEIVDSRIAEWDITFADTVADNASSGVYVLGTTRRTLEEVAPVEVQMTMTIDGELVSAGDGAACLGDPLHALTWLARRAREFGEPLRAGQVILSGALGPMCAINPGSTVTAEISGLGSVTAHFSTKPTI
ncbi:MULTISPECIES: 2-keto-4-pentenoate hydratase [Actinomycetes]|uniref:2-keto-4-pentenoate hydratase n=1 Tax=Kitasatospora arboriphila TaxID=258052 RepID=UPI0004C12DC0|nr:fumarylacetoacetate hydrolase family protein [Kitasatospora arboriphila]